MACCQVRSLQLRGLYSPSAQSSSNVLFSNAHDDKEDQRKIPGPSFIHHMSNKIHFSFGNNSQRKIVVVSDLINVELAVY